MNTEEVQSYIKFMEMFAKAALKLHDQHKNKLKEIERTLKEVFKKKEKCKTKTLAYELCVTSVEILETSISKSYDSFDHDLHILLVGYLQEVIKLMDELEKGGLKMVRFNYNFLTMFNLVQLGSEIAANGPIEVIV